MAAGAGAAFADALRIALGLAALLGLLAWDLARHGRRARRLREYAYLVACVAAACAYGAANDQVTVTLSPAYFLYGKGLAAELGPDPAPVELRLAAARVGLAATWWTGLVAGAAILTANSLGKRPSLTVRRLVGPTACIVAAAAAMAVAMRIAGWFGSYHGLFDHFRELPPEALRWFETVWGIHLGGYLGGLAGTAAVAARTFRRRRILDIHCRGRP